MDCRKKSASNAAIALVVRQFSPSRIERQLLTQVFECVVAGRREANEKAGDHKDPTMQEVLRLAVTTSLHKSIRSAG
jgi:hypothetical protein